MESYSFQNVTFTYPEQRYPALKNISFSVSDGEFIVICGKSGCGKSTLLRQMKTCLTPFGSRSGDIFYHQKRLSEVESVIQAQEIGFVFQSPDAQVVTDKVWHELAFGLESLGCDTPTIRRKVAETASFFGIESWFYKSISELSGGQKQLLNLAAIMTMQPKVIILDEPTAQLDPIAAARFFDQLKKINRELGITIILTEHRLEEVLPLADRVIVMEKGEIICADEPKRVGLFLKSRGSEMFSAMPAAMRVWAAIKTELPCPVTVAEGSSFLTELNSENPFFALKEKVVPVSDGDTAINAKNLWFRYEKELPDILKGFSLTLKKGEFYALLGGNGTGKSTMLKVLSKLLTAHRGEIDINGRLALLPQDPQTLFVKKTVREDLREMLRGCKLSQAEQQEKVATIAKICGLTELLERHPYDISGGEQQRCALAKVLLTSPDIILLDEPTKGLDAGFKAEFAAILKNLTAQGVTILMVSHDIEFCAEYAHRCGLFFDGSIVTEAAPRDFFSGNSFYTTAANRMARHLLPRAITVSDIVSCCGYAEAAPTTPQAEVKLLPKMAELSERRKSVSLPLWRKAAAVISAFVALMIFFFAASITDLSKFITSNGVTEKSQVQMLLCLILIADLAVFILSVGQRSASPVIKPQKKRPGRKTRIAAALILLFIPLTIFTGVFYLGDKHYNLVSVTVLLECMLPFFLVFEGRKPKTRELVIIAVLCAIAVASRSAFFMLPQFKPVLALTIMAGVALGGESGFIVGAVTMLVSNIIFSQGPWTPWQMFGMGIIGFLAGILFQKGWLCRSKSSLAAFGAFSAVVIYGGIMNFAAAVMGSFGNLNRSLILAYYISGFPMDLIHACATVITILLIAEPMLEKLDRVKVKYGIYE
ncbi:MAG: ATP-binding cassette domain-containing protein [Oscillospiraceae bacterium]|nr:ATP-binding cassette domain-containing protein [Oscillospiraceae bacterium]